MELEQQLPIRVPATRTGEMYDLEFKGWTTLGVPQVLGIIDLLKDHPALDSEEKKLLDEWTEKNFFFGNGNGKNTFRVRNGGPGFFDLLRVDSSILQHTEYPEVVKLESIFKKIHEGTAIRVIDAHSFKNPSQIPLELQYALGHGGENLIRNVRKAVTDGNPLVFMQVKTVPQDVHEALHILKHHAGGVSSQIIDAVRTGKKIDLRKIDPKIRPEIEEAQNKLKTGARKLLHLKILSPKPDNPRIERLEKRINNILDHYVDIPYALWRYTLDLVGGDVKLASGALGFSTVVAAALTVIGLGNSATEIEGLKLAVSPLAAELPTIIASAAPLIKADKRLLARAHSLLTILKEKDYLIALGVGFVLTPLLGEASAFLQAANQNLWAGLALGLSAPLPTWLALKATEKKFAQAHGNQAVAKKEMDEHPVEKALMPGSLASLGGTTILGPLGLLKYPPLVNFTTQMLEQFVSIGYAVQQLLEEKRKYQATISKDPVVIFQNTISK